MHVVYDIGANQHLFGNVTAILIFQKLLGLDLISLPLYSLWDTQTVACSHSWSKGEFVGLCSIC